MVIQQDPPMDENTQKWQGLVRASILAVTTHKLFGYVSLADQKAMGLIVLNSIIIPIVLAQVDTAEFQWAATISIVACAISMFSAMVCIFPKRRAMGKPDGSINPLHFSDIARMSENEYMEIMRPLYNTPSEMGMTVIRDIHDVSSNVLKPKFFWLKLSYIIFFIGNLLAIATELYTLSTTQGLF